MLTDDSAGEQCAVRKAFRGLEAGEQEVSHFLCRVHSQRTLLKAFPGKDETNVSVRRHLLAALYNRKTRPGCEQSVQAAIDAAPPHRRAYLEKEWRDTMPDWANYARCHSPLLLQVPSTNCVESWHGSLKYGVKLAMTRWSLQGLLQHLANVATQWDLRAEVVKKSFRTKILSETTLFPGMQRLPYPVQKLVLGELTRGYELISEGADPQELGDDLECGCLFFRQYSLPCAHMWLQQHTFGAVLEDESVWERFVFMFDECGFEIYEGMSTVYLQKELDEEIGAPAKRRLEVRLSSLSYSY